ncbi:hypothetical protein BH20CHL1_BH20CHL1_01270 [soil metagenome]|jgi:hypothetical protein
MNAREGLERIRERLYEYDARTETLDLVDTMIKRASVPGAEKAQASMSQLVRMLTRTPVANQNVNVYNDLVRLEEELDVASSRRRAEAEAEEAKPLPKSKKYYKDLKAKEQAKRG